MRRVNRSKVRVHVTSIHGRTYFLDLKPDLFFFARSRPEI